MSLTSTRIAVFASLLAASCGRRHATVASPADRIEVEQRLAEFQTYWLAPAKIAPPTIDFVPRSSTDGKYEATIRPYLPEDAAWNQWPSHQSRLFNNRAAYLFQVRVEGPGPLRWLPGGTHATINGGAMLLPAQNPDELLRPLLEAALEQERHVLDGDLVERTRAAGAFRAIYLPLAQVPAPLQGTIAFPLNDADAEVGDIVVTVEVAGPDGPHVFSFHYD